MTQAQPVKEYRPQELEMVQSIMEQYHFGIKDLVQPGAWKKACVDHLLKAVHEVDANLLGQLEAHVQQKPKLADGRLLKKIEQVQTYIGQER